MALNTLDTTLIAAGAAILGSVISTVPGAWLSARKDRREQYAATAQERGQQRKAARLVILELSEAADALERGATPVDYVSAGHGLEFGTWRQFGPDLASAIDDPDDWQRVTEVYDSIYEFNARLESGKAAGASALAPPCTLIRDLWH